MLFLLGYRQWSHSGAFDRGVDALNLQPHQETDIVEYRLY